MVPAGNCFAKEEEIRLIREDASENTRMGQTKGDD